MASSDSPDGAESAREPAPSPPRRGFLQRVARALGWALLASLALGVASVAGGRAWLLRWADLPQGPSGTVDWTLPPGTGFRDAARSLHDAGLVDLPVAFEALALLEGRRDSLQAGRYRLPAPISPRELLNSLRRGTFERKLTIPEGWTAARVERELLAGGWIAREGEWTELVARPVDPSPLGEPIPSAEGFCFPETYRLEPGTPAEAIRDRMLATFAETWRALEPARRDERSRDLSTVEVVILASIVQREARRVEEMPRIASVFLNRMRRGMKLQSCATVHHALGEWGRALRFADLECDSPYNTYRHAGLPPGPIGAPGREALAAVLRPAAEPFLYFVHRGDGTHEFTRTYAEHARATRRFAKGAPAMTRESEGEAGD